MQKDAVVLHAACTKATVAQKASRRWMHICVPAVRLYVMLCCVVWCGVVWGDLVWCGVV